MKTIVRSIICAGIMAIRAGAADYTAHEWGTFTSVQGGDGKLLYWRPLESSELPKFVYNSGNKAGTLAVSKTDMATLQRLETPVIYFYAREAMKVDVDVAFPLGAVTEWYPHVTEMNPSHLVDATTTPPTYAPESRAIWRGLALIPNTGSGGSLTERLPLDAAGSHYFAARKTTANILRTTSISPAGTNSEYEKFIFYRGAGSFETPLRVTVDSQNVVTVENHGPEPFAHLFLLNIRDGRGAFTTLDELAASNSVRWTQLTTNAAEHWKQMPLAEFQDALGAQVEASLVDAGLYSDEAKAMVATWKDSWFTEDGVRVLYLLPRPWTDGILPLHLTPAPAQLTRVMVGRAEVITPQADTNFLQLLSRAKAGDLASTQQVPEEFKKLGRFAAPALSLALSHTTDTNLMNFSYELYGRSVTAAASSVH